MADGLRLTQLTRKLEYAAKADLFYVVSSTGTGISRSYRISLDNIGKGIKFNVLKPDFDKIESNWTTTQAYSGSWQAVYNTTNTLSSYWQSAYTTVYAGSANWQSTYSTVNACSSRWDSTYSTVNAGSANWQSTYSTVEACSAKWELDAVYPVGSIHMSVCSVNPMSYAYSFPGCWIPFGAGRVLMGAGTGTDINGCSIGFAGGACGGEYTHRLTTAEMPSHSHVTRGYNTTLPESVDRCQQPIVDDDWDGIIQDGCTPTSSVGGNAYHNNIQPYVTVYMWHRCA